jgi:hypothetical protein
MVTENKKTRKIGVIDILIILFILTAVIGAGYKYKKDKAATPHAVKTEDVVIVYYSEEVPESAAKAVKIGDPVREALQNASFGNVTAVEVDNSVSWARNHKGELVKSTREGYSSITVTINGKGVIGNNGVTLDKSVYYIGQTITLYVGNSSFSNGRISEIKKKE